MVKLSSPALPRPHLLAALMPALLLAACGSGSAARPGVQSASASVPVRRPPGAIRQPARRPAPPTAHAQVLPGLEGVIGATTADLARQFGTPRLDVWEGDARKLQFTGTACILDVYLYPEAPGREPQATFVDARRTDGQDVDRAACVAALKRR